MDVSASWEDESHVLVQGRLQPGCSTQTVQFRWRCESALICASHLKLSLLLNQEKE